MGRMATAEEIAAMVVYLASDEVGLCLLLLLLLLLCVCYYFYRLHSLLELNSRLMVDGVCNDWL